MREQVRGRGMVCGVSRRGIMITAAGCVGVGAVALGWLAGKECDAVLANDHLKQDQSSTIGKDLSPNGVRRIAYEG